MPRRRRGLVLAVACAIVAGTGACDPESLMTTADARDRIDALKSLAAERLGWRVADLEVGDVSALDRGDCRFYRVSNPKQLDAAPVEFVLMADGSVVGGDREQAAARIGEVLRTCGADAPPLWWAQVVSRFAGTGGVLVDDNAPSAVRRLRRAGIDDPAPRLRQDGGDTLLRYFTHDYDRGDTRQVDARLGGDGRLAVDSRPLADPEP